MKGVTNKDVRAEGKRLQSVGYQFEGFGGSGHLIFRHTSYGTVYLPTSPSDWRWVKNLRREVAHQMGVTLRQVEKRMGVPLSRSGRSKFKPAKRARQNGVARSFIKPAPKPSRNGVSPKERQQQISLEIEGASIECDRAMPSSPDYEKTLDRIAHLRAEYLQIEADRGTA